MFKNISKLFGTGSEDTSFYLLMDEIDDDSVKGAIEWILSSNFIQEGPVPKQLTLFICSPGGSAHSAFALIDVMRGSTIPVATVGIGGIASAGVLIMMAGAKGQRVLTPNTSVMSHQFGAGMVGKRHELLAIHREWELTDRRIVDHYIKCTGLPEKKVRDSLLPASDVWMTAEEAVKYGIADAVKDLK